MARKSQIAHITREQLEPSWNRLDITVEKIAQALGVTTSAVTRRAAALGLKPRGQHKTTYQKMSTETFKRLYLAGVATREIAEAAGYTGDAYVSQKARYLGLPPRSRGDGNGGWKKPITMAQFREQEIAQRMSYEAGGKKMRAAGGEDRSQMWK